MADVAGNATSLDAVMNAEAVKNAAAYYRTMVGGGAESWNLRDRHMADTLNRLMQHYGSDAKRSSGSTTPTLAMLATRTWRTKGCTTLASWCGRSMAAME